MSKINGNVARGLFFVVWLIAFLTIPQNPLTLIAEYGVYAVLGIIGAIFANATGAGGGVVFVPFSVSCNWTMTSL